MLTTPETSTPQVTPHDWIVTNAAQLQPLTTDSSISLPQPYRLYRLLADIDDILDRTDHDHERLAAITPRVRHFLTHCDWLGVHYIPPDPNTGWSVATLYDEPDYPLTVQLVAWAPGSVSKIHNHAAWGLVAMIEGCEKNSVWKRDPSDDYPDRISLASEQTFDSGDIVTFLPDAIHCVEAISNEPTVSFNLYGQTNYRQRYHFDRQARTATLF